MTDTGPSTGGSSGSRSRTPAPAPAPSSGSETVSPELAARRRELGITPTAPPLEFNPNATLPISDEFAQAPVIRAAPVNPNNPAFIGGGRQPNFVERGGPEQHVTSVGEWMHDFTGFGRVRIEAYQNMMQRAGLLSDGGFIPGVPDKATLSALGTVLGASSNARLSPESVLGIAINNQERLAAQPRRSGGGGGGRAAAPPPVSLSNREDLVALLEQATEATAGRNLESLGIDANEFADQIQNAEREAHAALLSNPSEFEQLPSASTRARAFLDERAAAPIKARQAAAVASAIENLVRAG